MSVGTHMNENINCASENRNVFTKFKEQLLSEGEIKWRYHTSDKDIVCMNDMDLDTGVLKPNDCTCNLYKELFLMKMFFPAHVNYTT